MYPEVIFAVKSTIPTLIFKKVVLLAMAPAPNVLTSVNWIVFGNAPGLVEVLAVKFAIIGDPPVTFTETLYVPALPKVCEGDLL
jgi:hypothetical protein